VTKVMRRLRGSGIAVALSLGVTTGLAAQEGGATSGTAATAGQQTDLGALLAQAVERHQAGDLEAAAALYEKIVAEAPDAARVRSNLGAVYVRLGRYDDALAQYRAALATENDPAIRFNLAVALQKSGQLEEAAKEAAKLVERFPDRPEPALLLAGCEAEMGQYQKVVDLLRPLAARHADVKGIAPLLGTALLELGRTDEAEKVLDPIFRDNTPESHVLLASMLEKRGEWVKARQELELARAKNPNLPLANFLWGMSLMNDQSSDWAGAEDAFRKELAINPTHFEANFYLGNLLRQEGNHAEAVQYLERAARLREGDLAVEFSLGAAYLALGRLDEAQALLEKVEKSTPDHLPTHMQLAILYARQGRQEDSQRERQAVVRLQQESEATRFDSARESIKSLLGKSAGSAAPDDKTTPQTDTPH